MAVIFLTGFILNIVFGAVIMFVKFVNRDYYVSLANFSGSLLVLSITSQAEINLF